MRKVFLENLPKISKEYNRINWKASIGYKVKFIYDDIKDEIEIVNYKNEYLYIKYLDEEPFKINSNHFKNGNLGKALGKYTFKFKIEINTEFKNDKRDITIINKKYKTRKTKDKVINEKWYKYHCNKCGYEGWIAENHLLKGVGCSCCCQPSRAVLVGYNDIPTTVPWMIKYFQGGYDEAKLYTKSSNQPIYPICPDCRRIKDKSMKINNIYKTHSIGCICSDGKSYPEKFMCSVLEQLKLNFQTQLTKTTFKWCNGYKYDFYFKYNNEQYIIETHGLQHYEESFKQIKGAKTVEQEQENDKTKKDLAIKNGIKEENYIVIDCRESELEYIKNDILHNDKLNSIFDLSNINWLKCEEFALSNLVKKVCEYWNNKKNDETTNELINVFKLSGFAIRKYLKQGTKLGWCNYNAKEEMKKSGSLRGNRNGKSVQIFKDNILLGTFESCKELERQSEKLFCVKLYRQNITNVCNGKRKSYQGYTFKYMKIY